jgi:hypothetical protein
MARASILIAATLLTLLGCSSDQSPDVFARQKYWQDLFAKELPSGSSVQQVTSFFSRHKQDSYYSSRDRTINALEDLTPGNSGLSSQIVTPSIAMQCNFDNSNKLTGCVASPVATGP